MQTTPAWAIALIAAVTLPDGDTTTLKRAYDLARSAPAVAVAQGAVHAARLRLAAANSRRGRLAELLNANAIDGDTYRQAVRDAALAAAAVDEATAELSRASHDAERLKAEMLCDRGNCGPLKQAYSDLLAEDAELARVAVEKIDVQVAYATTSLDALRGLYASGSIDARVVSEAETELTALQGERDAAEEAKTLY
jgi:hypothetical protein